ncbi:glycosyltransferase family 2 protein [Thermogutta sp.]|uniref:glycosyltransferase family 2 protein n=1 Tax=Thermogutta sp. TaxID=1962930 RepID=UPI0032208D72
MDSVACEGVTRQPLSVSVVVPLHNEAGNIETLHSELREVLQSLGCCWDICYVDDGSTDETPQKLAQIAERDGNVQVIFLTRRFGQAAALRAGMDASHGDIVITLDGDLQNDPRDIPHFLAKIAEGYDVVHGWRLQRQDSYLRRRLPSQVANWLIRKLTGAPTPDLGCGIRAMRRWVVEHLELVGDMHRYLPILARDLGARSTVIVVNHRPRRFGKSKYGLRRFFAVLADLPLIIFLTRYRWRPIRLMAALSTVVGCLGTMAAVPGIVWTAFGRLPLGIPLVAAAVVSWGMSLLLLAVGLLAELQVRLATTAGRNAPYLIRSVVSNKQEAKVVRFPQPPSPVSSGRTGSFG